MRKAQRSIEGKPGKQGNEIEQHRGAEKERETTNDQGAETTTTANMWKQRGPRKQGSGD